VNVAEYATGDDTANAGATPVDADSASIAALKAENELLKRENDRLWQALAMAMQNEQRLIEAQTPDVAAGNATADSSENKHKWWQFWK